MLKYLSICVLICASFAHAADPLCLNVRDYGATGDAKTDDTAAFQKTLDAAGQTGSRVAVPAGRYLIAGNLKVPPSVTLEGTFTAPERTADNSNALVNEKGSILLTTAGKNDPNGKPFITLNRSSTLKGVIVFYPEQTEDVIPYPWCVRGVGDNTTVRDVLLINPYQAVDLGSQTQPAGRHFISGLYGQPLKTGISVDKCFDIGRIENVHFWPFWNDSAKMQDYTKANGTAFVIARTDWEYMSNCFCIAYKIGYHFTANKDGPGNAILTQCGSDIGPLSVKVDQTQTHAGVSFSNSQFMCGVEVGPDNSGPVKFTSCGFWGVGGLTDQIANLNGTGNVTFTACHFIGWAQKDSSAPCIVANRGGLTVNGCEFLGDDPTKNHIELGSGVDGAIITANRFHAPPKIANHSDADVEIAENVTANAHRAKPSTRPAN